MIEEGEENPGRQLRSLLQGVAASKSVLHIVEGGRWIFVEEVERNRKSSATNVL
jgi:hypothetical protein